MSDEQPVAATRAMVAVGRPEDPTTPMGRMMNRYQDSTRRSCAFCGRSTWYGPRLMQKIIEGAIATCGDCAYKAIAAGARPSEIVHLGGTLLEPVPDSGATNGH